MTKEQIQTYTLRVSQASACELVVILYDIILEDIRTAREAKEKGNLKAYREDLRHAGIFLNELMQALDYSIPLSYRLIRLYQYVNQCLVRALAGNKEALLQDAELVMEKLRTAFDGIKEHDRQGPVMQNVQQIYAGLTYGKSSLNESYYNPQDYNRGFLA